MAIGRGQRGFLRKIECLTKEDRDLSRMFFWEMRRVLVRRGHDDRLVGKKCGWLVQGNGGSLSPLGWSHRVRTAFHNSSGGGSVHESNLAFRSTTCVHLRGMPLQLWNDHLFLHRNATQSFFIDLSEDFKKSRPLESMDQSLSWRHDRVSLDPRGGLSNWDNDHLCLFFLAIWMSSNTHSSFSTFGARIKISGISLPQLGRITGF